MAWEFDEDDTPQTPAPAQLTTGTYQEAMQACGTAHVVRALERNPGNKAAAARELGLTRATLYNVLHRIGWESSAETRDIRAQSGAAGARARWAK